MSSFSDFDFKVRSFMGYWDYMAFDNAKDVLIEYMAPALDKIKDENLVDLCEKYGLEVDEASFIIKNTIDQVFSLDYYMREKQGYALATVEDVEMIKEVIDYESLSLDEFTMLKVYLEQNVNMKERDEEDLDKLMDIVKEEGEDFLNLGVVDRIKRERFETKENYLGFIKSQLEFGDSLNEIMTKNFGGVADKLFQDFYVEHLSEIHDEMYMAVYERKASELFKVEGLVKKDMPKLKSFPKELWVTSKISVKKVKGLFKNLYRKFYK